MRITRSFKTSSRHKLNALACALLIALVALMVTSSPAQAAVAAPSYQSSSLVASTAGQTMTFSSTITRAGTLARIVVRFPTSATVISPRAIGNTGPGKVASYNNLTLNFVITKPYAIPVGNRPWLMISNITTPSAGSFNAGVAMYDTLGNILSSGTTPVVTFTAATACPKSWPSTYVKTENVKGGHIAWRLSGYDPAIATAYADRASAVCGDNVRIAIHSSTYRLKITAYRMGYYFGLGSRQIRTTSGDVLTYAQPAAVMVKTDAQGREINMPTAKNWSRTFNLRIDGSYPPGDYLIKIVDANNRGSYVPLAIRDDGGTHARTLVNSVATWQAYNTYGGASSYTLPVQSKRVSLDRPYNQQQGSGQFLALEYGFVYWAEHQGLDLNYAADIDLHSRSLYDRTKTLIVMAHSEYWSTAMRSRVNTALSQGKNLASFGANQMYWRINPMPSTLSGANREFEIFRTGDTARFRDATPPMPEQAVLGGMFGCMHMEDSLTPNNSWLWTNVAKTPIPNFWRGETDQVVAGFPVPAGSEVLQSSKLSICNVANMESRADITAVTFPGGGRSFNASTHGWGCKLGGKCSGAPVPTAAVQTQLGIATMNALTWLDTRSALSPALDSPLQKTGPLTPSSGLPELPLEQPLD